MVNELLNLMEKLPEEKKCVLQELLLNAPYWLLDAFIVVQIPKNTMFIKSGEESKTVYILIDGHVKATDYRIYDVVYDYTWFEPIEIFGAMEFYMGYDAYITTLITMTNCKMLEIPMDLFKKWLLSDVKVVLKQVKDMMQKLDEQSKKERAFLFLNGTERLYYLLVSMYNKQHTADGICEVRLTKEELANYSGVNVRTVNRVIKQMDKNQLIIKEGRKILINEEQCKKMESMLTHKTT
ncbi:Crp/Fnr family transcriptional regulator [Anaerosacchariphilus polymeriproducens]|uniref:Crp/Fnr family transcriptional regulator n=1 Tax=Anaerosacchariphilus polymeriproducens TaxID=1812858 RepID=A0A371ASP4_9FIRM|nr:Crp/Fnr family transcriptional regulator [Anaerosacchariphilus polymeriproducens]RDU22588.1 Crp/Fnr family transcriptional regulator [Anaerosacchariphilus polymeriproducens]